MAPGLRPIGSLTDRRWADSILYGQALCRNELLARRPLAGKKAVERANDVHLPGKDDEQEVVDGHAFAPLSRRLMASAISLPITSALNACS